MPTVPLAAQRGAFDWWKRLRCHASRFPGTAESVAAGKESQRSIDSNSQPDYRNQTEKLKEPAIHEPSQAGGDRTQPGSGKKNQETRGEGIRPPDLGSFQEGKRNL